MYAENAATDTADNEEQRDRPINQTRERVIDGRGQAAKRRAPGRAGGRSAIIHERQNDRPRELGTQSDSSEPKGQELNYSAHISLDRTKMRIDDRMVNLSPGMAVTVEIKTGSRKILSYLLSPLLRYRQETLRER
jgi:hypothetical protein